MNLVLEKAIEKYGKNKQLDMVIEEMSELTKEICKQKRGKDNREEIIEEIADVRIMLEQLEMMFNIKATVIYTKVSEKIERLRKRMEEEE